MHGFNRIFQFSTNVSSLVDFFRSSSHSPLMQIFRVQHSWIRHFRNCHQIWRNHDNCTLWKGTCFAGQCPRPSASGLISTCFNTVVEHDSQLATQFKLWYDTESYGTIKQVEPHSASSRQPVEILDQSTVHEKSWWRQTSEQLFLCIGAVQVLREET